MAELHLRFFRRQQWIQTRVRHQWWVCLLLFFFSYSFGLFFGFKSIKTFVKAQITLRKIII